MQVYFFFEPNDLFVFVPLNLDAKSPDMNTSGHLHESQDNSAHGPPRSLFGSPPPNFNKNSSLDSDSFDGSFDSISGDMSNRSSNPFSSNNNSRDILHRLQQHPPIMMHQSPHMNVGRNPRPLLDLPTGFNNNPRPFMHHGQNALNMDMNNRPPMPGNHNPFMMNSPRAPSGPFLAQSPPMNNFRGAGPPMMRNNTPYNRNPRGNMRGGFRNNFRGGNMRGNW